MRADTTFIYALLDPRTGEIRYVGKADNPEKRLLDHLRQCNYGETHRARWLRSLIVDGLRPLLEVIDEVADTEWEAAECAYIAFYKECGHPLVNATPGGESPGGGKDHPLYGKPRPSATRTKISAALKGKCQGPLSAAHRAKISMARKGLVVSEVTRAKLRAANTGWKPSPEQRAKLVAALIGRKHSPATIAKIRASAKGRVPSEATRLAQIAAVTGSRHAPEHRAKRSASLKLAWEKRRAKQWLAEMWN